MQVELINLVGIAGGLLFGFAAVPTAFRTLDFGHSVGTPLSVAWSIFIGCICMFSYLTVTNGWDWIIACVYGVETSSWGIIVWYGMLPRGSWSWR